METSSEEINASSHALKTATWRVPMNAGFVQAWFVNLVITTTSARVQRAVPSLETSAGPASASLHAHPIAIWRAQGNANRARVSRVQTASFTTDAYATPALLSEAISSGDPYVNLRAPMTASWQAQQSAENVRAQHAKQEPLCDRATPHQMRRARPVPGQEACIPG